MIRSKFVYDRSLQRDVASVLASVRHSCTYELELAVVDRVCEQLADLFGVDSTFDAEDFLSRCSYLRDRAGMTHERESDSDERHVDDSRGEPDQGARAAVHAEWSPGVFLRVGGQSPLPAER